MEKDKSIFKRFNPYIGSKKIFIPVAIVFSAIATVLNMATYIFIWLVIRNVLINKSNFVIENVNGYIIGIFTCAILGLLLYLIALLISHLAAFQVEAGMRQKGMENIMKMPLGFFSNTTSGKIRKIINDGGSITHEFLAHQLPDLAGSFITPVLLVVFSFIIDWRMGLISLVPIILAFIFMGKMFTSKGQSFQKKHMDSLEEMSSESVEYVRGIPVVKTFGQSIFSFKRFYNSIMKYKDYVAAYTLSSRLPMTFYTVIMQSTPFFLIILAIFLIGRGEDVSLVLTNLIFFVIISGNFALTFMKSAYFGQTKNKALDAVNRLEDQFQYKNLQFGNINKFDKHEIEFKNVSFSYVDNGKKIINNISFKINEGETFALVGKSGGGKTTIARLVPRFWDVDEGEVLVGGVNIKEYTKKTLMDNVSFVFQNTKLFKTSIRENIVFGRNNISIVDLNKAIDASQSRSIVDSLPNGVETIIGSKGTYLSGGEQQRIALARSILKDAPIVILDEATAFADPENEELIQKALKELRVGKTTLMIAHRLSSVVDVDKILFIKDGIIAEAGNHDELLAKGGLYKEMWDEYEKSISWKISSSVKEGGSNE